MMWVRLTEAITFASARGNKQGADTMISCTRSLFLMTRGRTQSAFPFTDQSSLCPAMGTRSGELGHRITLTCPGILFRVSISMAQLSARGLPPDHRFPSPSRTDVARNDTESAAAAHLDP